MKELDEAREQLDDILSLAISVDNLLANPITRSATVEHILNLKGDGWKIAIIKDDGSKILANVHGATTYNTPHSEPRVYKPVRSDELH